MWYYIIPIFSITVVVCFVLSLRYAYFRIKFLTIKCASLQDDIDSLNSQLFSAAHNEASLQDELDYFKSQLELKGKY